MKSPEPNLPEHNLEASHSLFAAAEPLAAEFYHGDTLKIAKALLGKGLFVQTKNGPLLAEIVEVEAYLGSKDPASHAYRGLSKRNWPMFERGGTCYVYLSYGLNYCMNVSTQKEGVPEAVLFRAARPIEGLDAIKERRALIAKETQLLNGPGKLCQGLGIDLQQNGWTLDRTNFKLIDLGVNLKPRDIGSSPRIGITKAALNPWRFFIKSSPWLSRKG